MSVEEGETTWNSGVPVGFDMREDPEIPGAVEGVCENGWNRGVKENVETEVEFFLKNMRSVWVTLLTEKTVRTAGRWLVPEPGSLLR